MANEALNAHKVLNLRTETPQVQNDIGNANDSLSGDYGGKVNAEGLSVTGTSSSGGGESGMAAELGGGDFPEDDPSGENNGKARGKPGSGDSQRSSNPSTQANANTQAGEANTTDATETEVKERYAKAQEEGDESGEEQDELASASEGGFGQSVDDEMLASAAMAMGLGEEDSEESRSKSGSQKAKVSAIAKGVAVAAAAVAAKAVAGAGAAPAGVAAAAEGEEAAVEEVIEAEAEEAEAEEAEVVEKAIVVEPTKLVMREPIVDAPAVTYDNLIVYNIHPYDGLEPDSIPESHTGVDPQPHVKYNFVEYFGIDKLSDGAGFTLTGTTAGLETLLAQFSKIYVAEYFEGSRNSFANSFYLNSNTAGTNYGPTTVTATLDGTNTLSVAGSEYIEIVKVTDAGAGTYTINNFKPLNAQANVDASGNSGGDVLEFGFANTVRLVGDTQFNNTTKVFEGDALQAGGGEYELFVDRSAYATRYKLFINTDTDAAPEITINIEGDHTDLVIAEAQYGLNGFMAFKKVDITAEYLNDIKANSGVESPTVDGIKIDGSSPLIINGTEAADTITADISLWTGRANIFTHNDNDNITVTTRTGEDSNPSDPYSGYNLFTYSVTDDGNPLGDPSHDHGIYILPGQSKAGGYDTITEKYFIENSMIDADFAYTPTANDYIEHNPDKLGIIMNGVDGVGDMNLIYKIQGFDLGGFEAGPTPTFKAQIDGSLRGGGELSYKDDATGGVVNKASLSFTNPTDNTVVDELEFKNGINGFGDGNSQIIEFDHLYAIDQAAPWEGLAG